MNSQQPLTPDQLRAYKHKLLVALLLADGKKPKPQGEVPPVKTTTSDSPRQRKLQKLQSEGKGLDV
jgi:hypothetical protein